MRVWKRLAVLIPAAVFAAVAALLVLLLPGPRSPLHYMVAGSLATAGSLVCVFIRLAGAKVLRRPKPDAAPTAEIAVETHYRIYGQL